MVDDILVYVWRYHLTAKEKYTLWFEYFSTGEQVRLWNKLVFAREWFRRAHNYSKSQSSPNSKATGKKKDTNENNGILRHDIYTMLKVLSSRMYDAGITDKELLLQKYSYLRKKDSGND